MCGDGFSANIIYKCWQSDIRQNRKQGNGMGEGAYGSLLHNNVLDEEVVNINALGVRI